jgi:cbb3-type cytochrome oxidase maturation protein
MELTWIAIAASLLMGGGALLLFIWAVRNHQFQSFEEVKYQVFWSDQEILHNVPNEIPSKLDDEIQGEKTKAETGAEDGSNGNKKQVN